MQKAFNFLAAQRVHIRMQGDSGRQSLACGTQVNSDTRPPWHGSYACRASMKCRVR